MDLFTHERKPGVCFAYSESPVECEKCGKRINYGDPLIVARYFYKGCSMEMVRCMQHWPCDSENPLMLGEQTIRPAYLVEEVQKGCLPVPFMPCSWAQGKMTTIDAATLPSERTKDRTRYAGRPEASIEGASVGNPAALAECEAKDALIAPEGVRGVLEGLRDGEQKVIEAKERRLLE